MRISLGFQGSCSPGRISFRDSRCEIIGSHLSFHPLHDCSEELQLDGLEAPLITNIWKKTDGPAPDKFMPEVK
jgi:hypothetical protein